jgi:type II secretory pathway pseudopilin PulG
MKKFSENLRAYTLVEVLIAAAILFLVVAAAASLSGGLTTQEILAQRTAIAINHQEQAARLWQLGLTPAAITNTLLLPHSSVSSLTFTESAVTRDGIGSMQSAQLRMVYSIDDVPGSRTNDLILLRPQP